MLVVSRLGALIVSFSHIPAAEVWPSTWFTVLLLHEFVLTFFFFNYPAVLRFEKRKNAMTALCSACYAMSGIRAYT